MSIDRATRRNRPAHVDALEPRRLLAIAAAISKRVLVVTADGGDQRVLLAYGYLVSGGKVTGLHSVTVQDTDDRNAAPLQFDGGRFDTIHISLGAGSDTFDSLFAYVDSGGTQVDAPSGPFVPDAMPQRPLTVDGGAGDDAITGSPLRETLLGGDDGDEIFSGGNSDSIDGGDGDDSAFVQRLSSAYLDERVTLPANVVVTVVGGAGDDQIAPDEFQDDVPAMRVDGGAGTDTIDGSGLADVIRAGDGDDYVSAGGGDDSVYGDAGNDTLTGGGGRNRLYGGDNNDRLNGSSGRDFLYGENGDDRLYGNAGNDNLDGGGGKDRLYGGDGDDLLVGGSSVDRLYGDGGNDTLDGGKSNDYLFGGDGTDRAQSREPGDLVDAIETLA